MNYYFLRTGEYDEQMTLPIQHKKEYTEEEFIDRVKEASAKFPAHYDVLDVLEELVESFGFEQMDFKAVAYFDENKRKWE